MKATSKLLVIMALLVGGLPATPAQAAPAQVKPTPACVQVLPRPMLASEAQRRLGTNFVDLAPLSGFDAEHFVEEAADPAFWLDTCGRGYYVEEALPQLVEEPVIEQGPYPYDQTFLLHSKPGASKVIYLDFNGATITGTAWNASTGIASAVVTALDSDGNPGSFSNAEQDVIQAVWQIVAEDYAPFDVDVTTEQPSADALLRSGIGDTQYGTTALIGTNNALQTAICSGGCGGVAYVGIYDNYGTFNNIYYQPALVFPGSLGGGLATKNIAEATSHEVGHNVGLSHDGTSTLGYYEGLSGWAPIMGVGYYHPLVQFSRGEYPDANQLQDDFAVMNSNGLPLRTDDHGNTSGTATAFSSPASGIISTETDVDWFSFTPTSTRSYTFNATPAPTSPNLDILLELYEGATLLSSSNPTFVRTSTSVAGGLSASLTATLTSGTTYYFKLDGVGNGSVATGGYSDWGSRGQYTLTLQAISPDAPSNVVATRGNASASVSWTAGAANDFPITSYTVTSSPGGLTCTNSATSCTVTGLTNGTSYTFTVRATSLAGTSSASAPSTAVIPGTTPSAPTNVQATRGDQQVSVSWSAPASNGGLSITGYTVTSSPGGLTCTTASTSCTVTGLTNGTSYTFTVVATNAVGNSAASSPSTAVTPGAVPGAPTGVSAVRGNASALISWTPGTNNGPAVLSFTVTSSPGNQTCSTSDTSCTVTGLTNGTSYTFTVIATNSDGNSLPSSPSNAVTPATVPNAPTNVVGTRGNAQVSVAWTAPSNNGSIITNYTVTSIPGSVTCSSSTSPCLVTGLTNGTEYTFTVTATNAVGTSASSAPSVAVTPATVPDAPTGVTAVRGSTTATVSWTAPANNGSAITSYTVTSSTGNRTCSTAGTSCTVTGLTNGTSYTFTVRATNAVGQSPVSTASNAITPAGVPNAPTNVVGTRGNAQVSVAWTAPANNGSAITSYTVTSNPDGVTCSSSVSPCLVTGLANGTSYTFTVTATNDVGISAASAASSAVTPATLPGVPTSVSGTRGNAQIAVSWSAPAANGGAAITLYTVTSSPGNFTCTSATTSCTVTGLANGTAYTFTVTATNAVGTSAASLPSAAVTPATVPNAPTSVVGTRGNTQVSVAWTAPANNGSAITGYTVTSSPDNVVCTSATSPCVVTGLTNGTAYTFTVRATNDVGNSAASLPSAAVTPATTPGIPTLVIATRGNSSASVSWTAPASNGGAVITSYTVTSNPGGLTCSSSTTSCAVAGLTNGTSYTFTVVATNAVGSSGSSAASNAVVPATTAISPTNVVAVAGNAQATVTWTAPTSNGGAPITSYVVTSDPDGLTCTSATTTCTVTALTNGTNYTFTVRAVNEIGTSASSASSNVVTPATVPNAPTEVVATRGNAQVSLAWTTPANNGSAITGYVVSWSGGSQNCSASPCVITGLSNGSSYQFTVVAINGIGSSSASTPSASVTPATVANAPTNVQATRGNTSAIVSWTAPANNGGDSVTLYIVTADPSGLTCSTGGTQCAVGGLTNGVEYTFTVVAQNSVGDSVPSQPSNAVTPASVPDVVTGLSAVPGDGEVTVSWNATNGNGSGIQQYRVTAYPGEATCTTQTISCVVQGLTNGVSYEFLVVATNVVGDSPESEFVGPVIPAGVPSAPSNVTALRGDKQAVVSWSASDARGSAITGYRVTASTNGQTCTTATTTCTVTGLVNGVAVSFVVVAINAIGESVASSASVSIKPAGLPKAPTTLRGTSAAVKKMLLQWSGASGNGSPIVRYEFSWKAATSSTWKPWKSTGLVRKAVVLGWLKGKKYQFKVRVVTSVGRAVSKTVTVIPTK